MNKKTYIVIAAIVLIVATLLLARSGKTKGFNTPFSNYPQNISYNASSTFSNVGTMTAANLTGFSALEYTPSVSSVTLTLPATSTIPNFSSTPGQTTRYFIFNATSTASITVTIAAGSGMTIEKPVTATTTAIAPGGVGILDFYRKSNTDMIVVFTNSI